MEETLYLPKFLEYQGFIIFLSAKIWEGRLTRLLIFMIFGRDRLGLPSGGSLLVGSEIIIFIRSIAVFIGACSRVNR